MTSNSTFAWSVLPTHKVGRQISQFQTQILHFNCRSDSVGLTLVRPSKALKYHRFWSGPSRAEDKRSG